MGTEPAISHSEAVRTSACNIPHASPPHPQAKRTRQVDDIEALQRRDYSQVKDASLLRFLVDMRDADLEAKQLRDDLMTMLIAGAVGWWVWCV